MITLGQLLAEGRKEAKMSLIKASEALTKYDLEVSDTKLYRFESGEPIKIDSRLIDALIEIYSMDSTKVYRSLQQTYGLTGVLKFVQNAVQNNKISQAIAMLETLQKAA